MTTSQHSWFIEPYYSVIYNDGKPIIFSSSPAMKGKAIAQSVNSDGYWLVSLQRKATYIHDIITSYFLGKKPAGMTVNHKNGDKSNNSIQNLEYMSSGDNTRHAISMGLIRIRYGAETSSYIDGRSKDIVSYRKAYRLANIDKIEINKKAYRLANRNKINAYNKAYRLSLKNKTTTVTTNE